MKKLLGAGVLMLGLGFGYAVVHLAVVGTGVDVPSGAGTVEGVVDEGELHESPAGDDFVYGEVRVARPGSRSFEASWSTPVGDGKVSVGGRTYTFPHPTEWRGPMQPDSQEVNSLAGLPVVGEVEEEARQRLEPPYLVLVQALRPGDSVIGTVEGDRVTELWVGTRAEIVAWRDAREGGRWPIVLLLGAMAVASVILGVRTLRG